MTQWQVHAALENGAVVMFGLEADSEQEALDTAHSRLDYPGQRIKAVMVESLAAAGAR